MKQTPFFIATSNILFAFNGDLKTVLILATVI